MSKAAWILTGILVTIIILVVTIPFWLPMVGMLWLGKMLGA